MHNRTACREPGSAEHPPSTSPSSSQPSSLVQDPTLGSGASQKQEGARDMAPSPFEAPSETPPSVQVHLISARWAKWYLGPCIFIHRRIHTRTFTLSTHVVTHIPIHATPRHTHTYTICAIPMHTYTHTRRLAHVGQTQQTLNSTPNLYMANGS